MGEINNQEHPMDAGGAPYPRRAVGISGFRGVRRTTRGRWQAIIRIDSHTQHIGVFGTPERAAEAYDERARELFGSRARLNFPAPHEHPANHRAIVASDGEDGAARIPLTYGLFAVIDALDRVAAEAAGHWAAQRHGRTTYAVREYRGRTQGLHQFITGWAAVDHISGNGLDNRRSNLRPATARQNARNRRMRADNSSGYKGVKSITDSSVNPWRARIQVDGKRLHIGLFATAEDAARAYDAAARLHFGEFAALNFPGPGERSAHN